VRQARPRDHRSAPGRAFSSTSPLTDRRAAHPRRVRGRGASTTSSAPDRVHLAASIACPHLGAPTRQLEGPRPAAALRRLAAELPPARAAHR
jgi:hypothetical protein